MPRGQGPRARRYRRAGSGFLRCDGGPGRSPPPAKSAVRSRCAFSTTSSRLSGPFGASCASLPIRQRGGISTWPCSAAVSPVMTPNRVVLPVPLRPTRPTRAPVGMRAEAPFSSVRPAMRTVRSSIMSMPRLLADQRGTKQPISRKATSPVIVRPMTVSKNSEPSACPFLGQRTFAQM